MNKKCLWEKIKGILKERLPNPIYEVWFASLKGETKNQTLYIVVPNHFSLEWIKENYFSLLKEVAQKEGILQIKFEVEKSPKAEQLIIPYNPTSFLGRKLSPKFTFEDFIVGKCNEFAYNICYQIATNNLKGYMVYLSGYFGLGKTHLTQAIGNNLINNGFSRVYYLTAKDFVNYMIKYLKSGMIEKFKEKFQQECDILLLEGIDFLVGKEYSQAELAFLIDYFLEENKTVVFTSLKFPQEISGLDSSLKSRLSSGLLIRLNPPDFETRKKIIKHKAKKLGQTFSYEVVEYLADHLRGDIRQIESAVLGLIARASILKEDISLSVAKEVIKELGIERNEKSEIDFIIESTCKFFGISKEEILSSSRKKEVTESRQIAMYLIRKFIKKSFKEIGMLFKREHSTVIYNIKSLEKKLYTDPSIRIKIEHISNQIKEELSSSKMKTNEKTDLSSPSSSSNL